MLIRKINLILCSITSDAQLDTTEDLEHHWIEFVNLADDRDNENLLYIVFSKHKLARKLINMILQKNGLDPTVILKWIVLIWQENCNSEGRRAHKRSETRARESRFRRHVLVGDANS